MDLVINTSNLNILIINTLRQHKGMVKTHTLESDCLDSKASSAQICSLGKVSQPLYVCIASTVKCSKNNIKLGDLNRVQ